MRKCIAVAVLALIQAVGLGAIARAQSLDGNPDVRNIKPLMMLVIDTSGSMERMPGCTCTSATCDECPLPDCNVDDKNRWALALEALTGSFEDFTCNEVTRSVYGESYFMPHYQPWACTSGIQCDYADPDALNTEQQDNGILDAYASRLHFGLGVFDGVRTYGRAELVQDILFDQTLSDASQGQYSFGFVPTSGTDSFGDPLVNRQRPDNTVVGRVRYPGCTVNYMIDTGIRNASADTGSLIGPLDNDIDLNNANIQTELLDTRPIHGTPIAAALDDLYYYFTTDTTIDADEFKSCRDTYALLLTDGLPDQDFRQYDCDSVDDPQYQCPYPTAEEAAERLVCGYDSTCDGPVDRLWVVGFDLGDASVEAQLDLIAQAGGSTEALTANDLSSLMDALGAVLDSAQPEAVSRTVPQFANGVDLDAPPVQYQVSTGFRVGDADDDPWEGLIEVRRFLPCEAGAAQEPDLDPTEGDTFHDVLNGTNGVDANPVNRTLYTSLPSGEDLDGHLYDNGTGTPCDSDACALTDFDTTNIEPSMLFDDDCGGDADACASRRDDVVDWVHGTSESERDGKRLGDIFHSTPAVIGPPLFDRADESFNEFRQLEVVSTRPLVLYVGTNDGVLHAFAMQDYEDPLGRGTAAEYDRGEEMWGFVPPMLLDKLESASISHQFMVDGSPAVKNVFFSRQPGVRPSSPDDYRTVLVAGLREGGKGYFAVDVTDPVAPDPTDDETGPQFLWQFTHEDMGFTYGQAAIVQVTMEWEGDVMDRAVAILPGGKGTALGGECSGAVNRSGAGFATLDTADGGSPSHEHREHVRCWADEDTAGNGRSIFIVDVETGVLVKQIEGMFPSPVTGTPAMFRDDVGTMATRGFVADADGVLWRIDLTGTDPDPSDAWSGWTARPFHDMHWDAAYDEGEPAYAAPILSVDDQGRVIVLHGTGDTDDFEDTEADNRIVSLTEVFSDLTDATPDAEDIQAAFNWEERLEEGELVTGPMALLDGRLFVPTYRVAPSGGDACDLGDSQVLALDFIEPGSGVNSSSPATAVPAIADDESGTDMGDPFNTRSGNTNKLFMGAGLVERPQCLSVDTVTDQLGQQRVSLPTASEPVFQVVMQASGGDREAGSDLGSFAETVPTPQNFTRFDAFAPASN